MLALVTVPGESVDEFSVITDATGSAAHVSEPTILWLMLLACMCIGMRRAVAEAHPGTRRRSAKGT